jgi:hypothetical protein
MHTQSAKTVQCSSDDEHLSTASTVEDVFNECPEDVLNAVRKYFCPALRDLLQHGMMTVLLIRIKINYLLFVTQPSQAAHASRLRVGCLPSRQRPKDIGTVDTAVGTTVASGTVHVWSVFVAYFEMKNGREFSDAPVRKLSQSFNLENIGGRAFTSRQVGCFVNG